MKLRLTIFALALLTFVSAAVSGLLYYSSLRDHIYDQYEISSAATAIRLKSQVQTFLKEHLQATRALAGLSEMMLALVSGDAGSLAEANFTLDHFHSSLEVSACYLMNADGVVAASSNRNTPTSFVGRDYSFRPYFQSAAAGRGSVFMARGVTSGRRGIYFAQPVYGLDPNRPLGAVVIKAPAAELEDSFGRINEGLAHLVSPQGIVFVSTRPDWNLKSLRPLSDEEKRRVSQTRQFGTGPWEWAGLTKLGGGMARDADGRRYLYYEAGLEDYPGWKVVYLRSVHALAAEIQDPLSTRVGLAMLAALILMGVVLFSVFRQASGEITSRIEAEEALSRSEEKYRTILETMDEGYFEVTLGGDFTFFNRSMCRILEYSREEMTGMNNRDYTTAETARMLAEHVKAIYQTDRWARISEHPVITRTGKVKVLELSVRGIKDRRWVMVGFRGVARDVTARKKAEEALVRSEERYRGILESIDEGYFEVDLAGVLTAANDAFCRIMGYERAEMLGRPAADFVSDESARRIIKQLGEMLESGRPPRRETYEFISKDGRTRYLQGAASVLRGEDGAPVGFHGLARDVTEQQAAQQALRDSEEKYRTVLEGNPDPVAVYDMEGRVVYFNPAFTRVFGWTLEEHGGGPMDFFVPEDAWPETREMVEMVQQGRDFSGVETTRLTSSGRRVPVSVSGAVYRDHEGALKGSIITLRDVRSQKQLEAQLQQAQKMEAVGTLASGIAHDFNNILQAISGSIQLFQRRRESDPDAARYLEEVEDAVSRASDLVQRLLTFSRRGDPAQVLVDVNAQVRRTAGLLERTIPKMVAIETNLAEELPPVIGDEAQLGQVLMNLGANAKDAMPDGGLLTIETADVHIDAEEARTMLDTRPGRYARLSVSDTGHGMDEETLDHIFEPFFTTKDVGRGTGLGLSTIYGIVKSHGGFISCRSRPGRGATFDVFFPAAEHRPEDAGRDEPARNTEGRGVETVLVVDDERAVREIAVEALEDAGYRVVEADSGETALEAFVQARGGLDAVVLDLGMPGMGGLSALKKMMEIQPDARVIIASGYSGDGQVNKALAAGAADYLPKPYRLADLLARLREILDRD